MTTNTPIVTTSASAIAGASSADGGLVSRLTAAVDAVGAHSSVDEMGMALNLIDRLREIVKELSGRLDQATCDWIRTNGDLTIGPIRYYLGPTKKTKCLDRRETLVTLIEQFGPEHVADTFLASECFKHGAISKELSEDDFQRLFQAEYEDELKEGKPQRPKKIDERFLK